MKLHQEDWGKMVNTIAALIASLAGLSGLLISIINRRESRARAQLDIAKSDTEGATATNVIIGASNTVVIMLEKQIKSMQGEMTAIRNELNIVKETERHCQSRLLLLERSFRKLLQIAQISSDDPRLM
jgi:hypothetical protein